MPEVTEQMQAVRVHAFGGTDVLTLDRVPVPRPGPGEALVRLEVAGVNFIDVYKRSGLYKPPLPVTLGEEGAGRVAAVGEGVTDLRVGDRVAWAMHTGAYAEYAVVPAWKLVTLPESVSAAQGAAVMLHWMTAHFLATSTWQLQQGQR